MKVLQVNVVFRRGSTGKIVGDLHDMLLQNGHESIVCFGRKNADSAASVYKISSEAEAKLHGVLERITGYSYKFSFFSTRNLLSIISKEKPDLVHLHILNGYYINIYKVLRFLKENRIPTVLTLHAELMHTGGCGHSYDCTKWKTGCGACPQLKDATRSLYFDRTAEQWNLMKKSFQDFTNLKFAAVSRWLGRRAEESPVLGGRNVTVIGNGIDSQHTFYPRVCFHLKEKHNVFGFKTLLHVTPSFKSQSKGGEYIVKLAKRLLKKKIRIIVVGFDGILTELPENIIGISHTKDQNELAEYYSLADLTVLTSKRETFSMVCAESLACGTPVVGFEAGAPEEIALPGYSEFVPYGNIDELESTILYWLERSDLDLENLTLTARKEYSRENMFRKYLDVYNEVISG